MASSVIGALRVNLGLDSAQFQDGLKKSQADVGKFGSGMKLAFAAAAAAAAGALAGISAAIKSNINNFDELSKSASKIGLPTEELSKLQYAADLSGVSLKGLETALGRLSRNISDASNGIGDGSKAFKELGIGVKDADGKLKPTTKILEELADRFNTLPDGAAKTALAMRLMGRSGADMIPLLNGGSKALNDLLNEAKSFGLEISAETGRAAEQFNDNLTRIGYAVKGVGIGLSAALAPALVIVSEKMLAVTQLFISALDYLPQVAEAAAVAGVSLSVAFGPAILASVGNLVIAIGVGLVGAVKTLTAVMLANPLGAFAAAVAVAIAAAYYFRDEIQKAIGLDVVQIAKDAANFIIGSFAAAFEDIKFIWASFPNIIGSAVIGAANLVIKVVNNMVNGAKMAINDLISAINVIPGVDIGSLDASSGAVNEIANPFADALSSAVAERNQSVQEALNFDYIGDLGAKFKASTPAVREFGSALGDVNDKLESSGGGGGKKKGGKSAAESYSDIVDAANRRIASLKAEQQSIGMTEEAAAALRYETDLLNQAQQKGITLTAAQSAQLSGLAASMASIEAATDRLREGFDFAKDATKGFLSDFRSGLQNGESVWASFGKAALNVLDKIIGKIEDQLVEAIFSMNGAFGGGGSAVGGGGIFGSIFGGIGKLFGFARGGTILPGGSGGIDSQLVAFRKSPNERVDITKPGQTLTGGETVVRVVGELVDRGGQIVGIIDQRAQAQVSKAAPSIVNAANQQVVPTMAKYQSNKAGSEWR